MQLRRQSVRILACIACKRSTLLISDRFGRSASHPFGPCSSYLLQAATAAAFGPAKGPSAHPCSRRSPTAAYRCCSTCSAHKPSPVRVVRPCRGTFKHVLEGSHKDDDPKSVSRSDAKACIRTSQVHWEPPYQSPQYAAASIH
jgi:hypothetical protein